MATGDTVLTDDSLIRRPEGLGIALTVPWYRSLWLSSVSSIAVAVDGTAIPAQNLRGGPPRRPDLHRGRAAGPVGHALVHPGPAGRRRAPRGAGRGGAGRRRRGHRRPAAALHADRAHDLRDQPRRQPAHARGALRRTAMTATAPSPTAAPPSRAPGSSSGSPSTR